MTIGSVAGGVSDIGSAVSDLFGAKGASASASSYAQASGYATTNAELATQATAIQEAQISRSVYKTIGTQQADVSGAGFASSGSALDLLRDSQSQGNLSKAMAQIQGDITAGAYKEQAGLYAGLASAAKSSAAGQTIGAVLSGVGGAVQLGSAAASALGLTGATASGTSIFGAATTAADLTAGAATDVAATAATDAATAGAADAAATAATSAGVWDTVASAAVDVAAVVGWVVCTELHKQGRMPARWYATGARRFSQYDETVKQGYYIWAVPATRHLRAQPGSAISWALERVFNHRAEYIAHQAGVKGARSTARGWAALVGVYALCWVLSRTVARKPVDWSVLYRGA